MRNPVEYDLLKASEERDLQNVTFIDYVGRTRTSRAWEPRFVSFKILKWDNSTWRFLYVFERVVYYQQADILDLDTKHGEALTFK